MPLKKAGAVVILVVVFLALLIAFIVLPEALPEATSQNAMFHVLVRLFGLYGYLFLAVATLTTPFLKVVTQAFGRPFLRVHHVFSVLGLVLITLHPVSDALRWQSLLGFVPQFGSWWYFWWTAGRPAFYLLYIGVVAALLRSKAPSYWRPFHWLMYVVLFFGIVHANYIGEDFENLAIRYLFDALLVASIAGLVFKRLSNFRAKRMYSANGAKRA
jgi:predicted ferric reductase